MRQLHLREILEDRAQRSLASCEQLLALDHYRIDEVMAMFPAVALCRFAPDRVDVEFLEHRGFPPSVAGLWARTIGRQMEKWRTCSFDLHDCQQKPLEWCARSIDQAMQAILEELPAAEQVSGTPAAEEVTP